MSTEKTKRITLPITKEIEGIRETLTLDTGVKMTYNQTIEFLVNFYLRQTAQQPEQRGSLWRKRQTQSSMSGE